jgi:hypothetical protein
MIVSLSYCLFDVIRRILNIKGCGIKLTIVPPPV